jgi:peptidoglycan/LPS O-acetylase OafA/YrhL
VVIATAVPGTTVDQTKQRLELLDLFRGIAASAVLIYHCADWLGNQWLPNAYLAVDLFFMLSGFVIAHNYDAKITMGMSLKEFMLHRGTRLFPCYWLALAIGLVPATAHMIRDAGYLDGVGLLAAAASNLFMLPALVPLYHATNMFPFNGASWTLAYELLANLAYWLIFPFLGPINLGVLLVVSAFGFVFAGRHVGTVDLGMREGEALLAIARVMFSFFAGLTLRRYVYQRVRIQLGSVGVSLSVLTLMATFCFSDLTAYRLTGEFLVIFAVYPVLLIAVSNTRPPRRLALISRFAGNISYPVYVLQTPVILIFAAVPVVFFHQKGTAWAPAYGVVVVTFIVLFSWWADKYFEWPFRRALKLRLFPQDQAARA